MKVLKNLPSILSVLSIVLSVAGLVFSPAGAAAANPPGIDGPGTAAPWYGIHGTFNATLQEEHLQTELMNLGQQGVDVSQPQADIASGNVTAAVQWLRGYLRTNPGTGLTGTRSQVWNSTAMSERLQTELTNLGQQGVDVSQPQADLTAGNVTAAVQWLHQYLRTNPGVIATGTRTQRFNGTTMNERLQTELTRLGQQGVDVSQPQADLTTGNVTAAVQWLRGYLRTNPGALVKMNGGQSASGNVRKGGPGFAWHRPSHRAGNTGSAA